MMTSSILKEDLPKSYTVKYLGNDEAHGLWGIKHTRKPVDRLVNRAKKPGTILPVVNLEISKDGCTIEYPNHQKVILKLPIETISYGVQDLVYTRVFSIIVVKDCTDIRCSNNNIPFECHAFVCDSRQIARSLTYTLADAFQEYSKRVRGVMADKKKTFLAVSKPGYEQQFAINLMSPEDVKYAQIKDSEA